LQLSLSRGLGVRHASSQVVICNLQKWNKKHINLNKDSRWMMDTLVTFRREKISN